MIEWELEIQTGYFVCLLHNNTKAPKSRPLDQEMNPLPLFQMSLNASQDHFSIGNVAKLKCDMGYDVNDQVNEKQKN